MKADTGNKRIICIVIVFALLFVLLSCQRSNNHQDEIMAMKGLVKYFEDVNNLDIKVFDKYNVSEREIYYYTEWIYPQENDNETHEFLIVYNTQTQIIQLAFFSDMEYGLYSNVKLKWDEVKGTPDRSFSEEDISSFMQSAIELREKEKAEKNK